MQREAQRKREIGEHERLPLVRFPPAVGKSNGKTVEFGRANVDLYQHRMGEAEIKNYRLKERSNYGLSRDKALKSERVMSRIK